MQGIPTARTTEPRVAVYPGSFDPVTCGHVDIIKRAAKQFDHLIVAVLNNTGKNPLFSVDERKALLTEVTRDLPNVAIDSFRDLLVRFMRSSQAQVIVRGIRSVTDFEYELQVASNEPSIRWRNRDDIYDDQSQIFVSLSSQHRKGDC